MPSANPGQLCSQPQIYESKLCSIYKILWHPDSFVCRDSIFVLAGRRAGGLFFALHRDYFIMTQNFAAIYRDLVLSRQIAVTPNSHPSTGTGKKQVTATQTAPNQTAGPLAGMSQNLGTSDYQFVAS